MADEFLSDVMAKGQRVSFYMLKPMQKILFIRVTNNAQRLQKAYFGSVLCIERNGKQVLTLKSSKLWQNGVLSKRYAPKNERFQYTTNDMLVLIEDVAAQTREEFIKQRKAYAQARTNLSMARSTAESAFDILGLKQNVTAEEFKALQRKLVLKYHPDRCSDEALSKCYMDALSYVRQFIKTRDSRIK